MTGCTNHPHPAQIYVVTHKFKRRDEEKHAEAAVFIATVDLPFSSSPVSKHRQYKDSCWQVNHSQAENELNHVCKNSVVFL